MFPPRTLWLIMSFMQLLLYVWALFIRQVSRDFLNIHAKFRINLYLIFPIFSAIIELLINCGRQIDRATDKGMVDGQWMCRWLCKNKLERFLSLLIKFIIEMQTNNNSGELSYHIDVAHYLTRCHVLDPSKSSSFASSFRQRRCHSITDLSFCWS